MNAQKGTPVAAGGITMSTVTATRVLLSQYAQIEQVLGRFLFISQMCNEAQNLLSEIADTKSIV